MSFSFRRFAHPLVLASLLTLANAAKPVVIDDTAYLTFARHLATDPLDPYGFTLFWYEKPEPAMTILLPPVLPYWLAIGIAIFGEHLLLLKLWLLPFAVILAYSARFLVWRFVSHDSPLALAVLVVGPGVLPFMNFMLDVPALALQLATIVMFLNAAKAKRTWPQLVLAGVCMGLGVQTKYSVLGLPVIILMTGYVTKKVPRSFAVFAIGGLVFVAWECLLFLKYDQSHFLVHLTRKTVGASSTGIERIRELFHDKSLLAMPLLSHLGLTVGWVGLIALASRSSARIAFAMSGLAIVMMIWILFAPVGWNVIAPAAHPLGIPLTFPAVLFPILGGLAMASGFWMVLILLLKSQFKLRNHWKSNWLYVWLLIELVGYFALTPFPAGRRVMGLSFVLALIVLRAISRFKGLHRSSTNATLIAGLVTGFLALSLDIWDAQPERALSQQAATFARERGWTGRGYFVGHWGFQYYAERDGLTLIEPGVTRLRENDWVVLPLYPDAVGFYRPYHGEADVERNGAPLKHEMEMVWDDILHAQTIPNLYGGRTPIASRFHSRLRIGIYRVTADWIPTRPKP